MTTYRKLLQQDAISPNNLVDYSYLYDKAVDNGTYDINKPISEVGFNETQYAIDWLKLRGVSIDEDIAEDYCSKFGRIVNVYEPLVKDETVYDWYEYKLAIARRELCTLYEPVDLSKEVRELSDRIAVNERNKGAMRIVARVNDLDLLLRLRPYTGVRLNMVEYAAMVVTGKFDVLTNDAPYASPNQLKRAMVNALESEQICDILTDAEHVKICNLRRDMVLLLSQYTPVSKDAISLLISMGDLQTIADLRQHNYL